jgi:IclR family transcriptional regulator, KDG regulon repressor
MSPRRNSPVTRSATVDSKAAANRNTTSTSVARAFAILDILSTKGDSGLALMDTANRLRMSKSTTHRYLITLERLGAVERDVQDRFHLGLKMIELAGLTLASNDLRKHAEPFLDELAGRTKETIHLAVPSGTEVVYIAKADSALSIRMFSYIGAKAPMYCTALGKAILAHSTAAKVNEVITAGLQGRTPHTITSRQALLDELDKVRSLGYAIDDEENEPGVGCVGAPIFDYSVRVIGAISISGPLDRMTRTRRLELGAIVRDTGLRLSKRLGYPH